MQTYDLIVIGAGSGGLAVARRAAKQYGKKVALIDPNKLGGTCINQGCVPKKIIFYGTEIQEHISMAKNYAFDHADGKLNWKGLKEIRDKYLLKLNNIYADNLTKENVTLIVGTAKFVNAHEVEVTCKDKKLNLTAEHIVIATGSKSLMPARLPGIEMCSNSDGFFTLEELPKSIFIIGGGYIGVEISGILNSLGVKCTICMMEPNIVWPFDREVTAIEMEIMKANGIDIVANCMVSKVEKLGDKHFKVSFKDAKPIDSVESEMVLCAMGRVPNYDGLDIEKIGIKLNKIRCIDTDEYENTSVKGIYAIGDINGKLPLTPVAVAAGRKLADRLFGGIATAKLDYDCIPSVVFGHPPMGKIGMIEDEAVEKYGKDKIKVYKTKFNSMYYAFTEKKEPTFIKMVCLLPEEKVIGLHALGRNVDEIIQGFSVAIKMGAKKSDFNSTVAIHPTSSEEFVLL